MIIDKQIEITVAPRTFNHYKEKGYSIPQKRSNNSNQMVLDSSKKIWVKIEDLPKNSHAKIKVRCDECGKIYETSYCKLNKIKITKFGNLCKFCSTKLKLPEAMKEKYGSNNAAKVDSIVNKKKETNLRKYGNQWHIASKEIRKDIESTFIKKYGVNNPMKNEEIKQKTKNTNRKKYGGNSPMCDEKVRAKSQKTCIEKYGFSNPFQSKQVQNKARKTLYLNNKVPSSKAERGMCSLLEKMFGKDKCFPSYPEGNLSLDCMVKIDNKKIDFEYDGKYWHKNKVQSDAARNAVLLKEGYRIVRIKANNKDTMPTKAQINEALHYLFEQNHHIAIINMED